MKRIAVWFMATLSLLVLVLGYRTSLSSKSVLAAAGTPTTTGGSSNTNAGTTTTTGSSGGASTGSSASSTSSTSSTSSSSAATTSATKTVTGSAVQTQWGTVQVQITVSGKKLTAVQLVQVTSGNPRDDQINAYANPILISEALKAQSANISSVAGASYSSYGFINSLQSALTQAGI